MHVPQSRLQSHINYPDVTGSHRYVLLYSTLPIDELITGLHLVSSIRLAIK